MFLPDFPTDVAYVFVFSRGLQALGLFVCARGLQDLSMSVHVVFKLSVCLCTWSSRSQYVCARGLLALNMFVYARGLQFLSMFVYARGLQALRMFASTVTMNFREIPEK